MSTTSAGIARGFAFAFVTAVITVLLAFGLAAATQGQSQEQVKEIRDATQLNANYLAAIGCELAVPADPVTGRDPIVVAACFTAQGLDAPKFLDK